MADLLAASYYGDRYTSYGRAGNGGKLDLDRFTGTAGSNDYLVAGGNGFLFMKALAATIGLDRTMDLLAAACKFGSTNNGATSAQIFDTFRGVLLDSEKDSIEALLSKWT